MKKKNRNTETEKKPKDEFGSLTPEEAEKYAKMLPSKSMIDKVSQKDSKRKSLFGSWKK